HHADLFANLVDEDQAGARLAHGAGEFAQRLRHQPRLQTHVAIAHFAIEFRFRHECRHGIDHQHIDLSRGHQVTCDLQRLFAIIGLRDEQVIDVHAELAGIRRVKRVLHVDEGGDSAALLGFGNDLKRDGGFARRFRSEDFDHTATGEAAHAQSAVKGNGTGGDYGYGYDGVLGPEAKDGTLAELLLNLA